MNMKQIKVLYTRVSTIDQKTDRQRVNESEYQLVIEDKCSGGIPFFERNGGKEILQLIETHLKKKNLSIILKSLPLLRSLNISIRSVT